MQHTARGVGGTPGGIWEFVLRVGMAVAGCLLLNQVTVTSGFWSFR